MSDKLSLVDLLTNPVRHNFLLGVEWNTVSTGLKLYEINDNVGQQN